MHRIPTHALAPSTDNQDVNLYSPPGAVVWGCNTLNRGVVLSFDDGPSHNTSQVLDALQRLGVKATFFICGNAARQKPEIVTRMAAEGHEVGVHTWTHANMTHLMAAGDLDTLRMEVDDTANLIMNLTGKRPFLFRPPYGAIDLGVQSFLMERGYTIVMWSAGCVDWLFKDATLEQTIYLAGLADAGGILCLHDSFFASEPDAVEPLVQALQAGDTMSVAVPAAAAQASSGQPQLDLLDRLHVSFGSSSTSASQQNGLQQPSGGQVEGLEAAEGRQKGPARSRGWGMNPQGRRIISMRECIDIRLF